MAEGGYFEPYPSVDGSGSLIPPITSFRHPGGPETFGVEGDKPTPGFYADQYHGTLESHEAVGTSQGHSVTNIEPMTVASTSHSHSHSHDYSGMGMPVSAALAVSSGTFSGMYDPPSAYNLKSEVRQHMPPTPPGSPDDPKDMSMQGIHGMGAMAPNMAAAQHLLAKPVPMRRLSEKRIAQARACLTNVPGPTEPLVDHTLGAAPTVAHAMAVSTQSQKRPRSEKKPVPEDLKDDKYFERRKRNNVAAKKSRDARKAREDEIAIRASFLEKENAILRAQVATLREEANSLRQLLLQKRSRP